MDSSRNNDGVNRREALKIVGGFAAAGALTLIGCQSESKTPTSTAPSAPPVKAPEPEEPAVEEKPKAVETAAAGGGDEIECSDEGIDDASKGMRTNLQYVAKSPQEGKICSGCVQWKPPENEGECGGCKLFTGPVNPQGYCISYVAQA